MTPKLTAGGYVFPVYGNSSFIDTFGAFRGDVSGGWHHGDDIFAALGSPLLAVAHGTVFSVGWNKVGGWRLWLRDDQGNEFYYAHLSAYSPLAVNGAIVQAGDVLGFVGNSGDAQGTPYHLHFEVHPVGLLGLGYDGAVDPTSYLTGWEHLKDVRFDAVAGWTPAVARGERAEGRRDPAAVVGHLDARAVSTPTRSIARCPRRRRKVTEGCWCRRRSNPPPSRSSARPASRAGPTTCCRCRPGT